MGHAGDPALYVPMHRRMQLNSIEPRAAHVDLPCNRARGLVGVVDRAAEKNTILDRRLVVIPSFIEPSSS